jgi:hypothetical protein
MMMRYSRFLLILLIVFQITKANDVNGQSWKFAKEKDGIKVYTRDEINSPLKCFRGEITFKAEITKVNLLVGNADNLDWWDQNISDVRIIEFQKDKLIRYYLIYHVPWPLSNRDLVLESKITTNPVTMARTVFSKPLTNLVPETKGLVRIKKYWQKWTVLPMENGFVHVIIEGFVDPNGNVPAWLYNMTVTETPYNVLRTLRERALSDKPAKG